VTPSFSLDAVVASVRLELERRSWIAVVLWALAGALAVVLAAWALADPVAEAGTPWPLVLDVVLAVAVVGIVAVVAARRKEWFSDRRVSSSMEEAAGLPSGTVLGSLELGRSLPGGVSAALARRATREVGDRLDGSGRRAGTLGTETTRWLRRGRNAVALLAPLLVGAALLTPERTAHAVRGLANPVDRLSGPALPPLEVVPGDAEVERGARVDIVAGAPMRDSVTLHWQTSGDVARASTAPVSEGSARFSMEEVRSPTRYRIVAPDGAVAGPYTITPRDPLLVSDVEISLTFPAFTGRPVEVYSGDVPPLTLPVGTRIDAIGSASRPLSTAALVDSMGATVASLDTDGPSFVGRWTPRRSGVYDWRFEDTGGSAAAVAPLPLRLTLVRDSAPTVRFTSPARDTVVPTNLRQPLVIEARDDYGVAELELVAYRVTSLGEREEPVVRGIRPGPSTAILARPVLDLSGWGLLPGDTVRYFARVRDNGRAGQGAETREYVLRMPGGAEMRRGAEQTLEDAAARMEDLAERAAESERETRAMERRAASQNRPTDELGRRREVGGERSDPMAFEEREDLRRSLEDQLGMESEVDSLRQELERMAEAMREAGMNDPGLREDVEELQELMREIAPVEQRERLEEMLEALERPEAERTTEQTLEELRQQQEAFRQRIEESIERFKRAAVEQDFRATTSEAEELARQEEALAEALREADAPEQRAEQQEELRERTGEMDGTMERLERRLQELGESEAAAAVREAREQSAQARESMQRAGQQARQRQGRQAGEQADQAAGQLQQSAQQLREAQQQMAQQQSEAAERALRQAAADALSLAREQSELRDRMRGATRDEIAEMRGDVSALGQGVRNMADNLAVSSQVPGEGSRELESQMGQAMQALERTVRAMENAPGAPSPGSAAEAAVEALNSVAMAAIAGAQQMAEGSDGQGQQSGEGAVMQQLEQLAQQQGQLNAQAGEMVPMQLGEQAMRSQMERMSQEQRSVGEELGDMAERPAETEDVVGDLGALAREAMELADELSGGRMDPETRRRQEQLFHRLLDAGRSLEKDEFSDERESEAPGAFTRGEVAPIGEDALRAVRFRLPAAGILQKLPPAERQLVIRYFERLNRNDPGGSGGVDRPDGPARTGGGGRR